MHVNIHVWRKRCQMSLLGWIYEMDGMYGWIEKEIDKNVELHSEQTLDDLDIVELSRTDPAVAELLRVLKEEDHVDLEEMLEVSMRTPGEKEALNTQADADAIMGDINEWENFTKAEFQEVGERIAGGA